MKCEFSGCNLGSYNPTEEDIANNNKKCILHCDKSDRMRQNISASMEIAFKYAFLEHIKIIQKESEAFGVDEQSLTLRGIHFPVNYKKGLQVYNYLDLIVGVFEKIHFQNCHFYMQSDGEFNLGEIAVLFEDCDFHGGSWYLYNYDLYDEYVPSIYIRCNFNINVRSSENTLKNSQFTFCNFYKKLNIMGCNIQASLFVENNFYSNNAEKLIIEDIVFLNCVFDDRLDINYFNIESICIKECLLKKKFNFKKNYVNSMIVDDSNFLGIVDFHGSEFDNNLDVGKSVFEDITVFEECGFGENKKKNEESFRTIFKHVTFHKLSIFREAIFYAGIDLSSSNFYSNVNFLNIKIIQKNDKTNRETYRLIKHNFDNVGNYIEANKYFAREMNAYRKEIKGKKSAKEERFVFWVNNHLSNYGQSFFKPLFWFLFIACITTIIDSAFGCYQCELAFNPTLINLWHIIASLFTNIPIFSHIVGVASYQYTSYIFTILYSIIYGLLTWQIIVAIKRKVKR